MEGSKVYETSKSLVKLMEEVVKVVAPSTTGDTLGAQEEMLNLFKRKQCRTRNGGVGVL
ncbi:cytosolic carboxypeptidase 1-like isoform X1, partial [Sesbania bispinosa]